LCIPLTFDLNRELRPTFVAILDVGVVEEFQMLYMHMPYRISGTGKNQDTVV